MKKKLLFVAALLFVMIFALAACAEQQPLSTIDFVKQKYGEIASAKSIKQDISITKGSLTQFESSKTFAKTESGYNVTGTEKTMNKAGSQKPFEEVEINETLTSAQGVAPTLNLDVTFFEEGYRLTESGLTATVKPDSIKDVFDLDDSDLTAPTDDLVLELVINGQQLTSVRITYTSDGSNVTILLTIAY